MTGKLVSDAAMAALRKHTESGMQTDVGIYPRTEVETASGSAFTWSTLSATVKGWLRSNPANAFSMDAGQVEAGAAYRLLLPVGTVVNPGDQVEIAGERYHVADSNVESTYKTSLRCMVRKLDR